MKRRSFIKCLTCGSVIAATQTGLVPDIIGGIQNACAFSYTEKLSDTEARFYKVLEGGGVECHICPRHCQVTDLERGYCGTRENHKDKYITLVHSRACAMNIDPIEKKPLFHFYPGTAAFSFATAGCNVNCKCCQNWQISQQRPEQVKNFDLPPKEIVEICQSRKIPTIAYTYSEPVIFYEYMYDTAELGHKYDLRSVMISGGYIETEPLDKLLPHLDAIKIDLKAIRPEYYKNYVDGDLKPVLERLIQIKKAGKWLELVYLILPTLNDTDDEFKELARWVKTNLGTDIPLHFSRFYPQYLLKHLPMTPKETMERALAISQAEGLEYVYLGNLPENKAESTYCPKCSKIVIERHGYSVSKKNLNGNACRNCGHIIPGVFDKT